MREKNKIFEAHNVGQNTMLRLMANFFVMGNYQGEIEEYKKQLSMNSNPKGDKRLGLLARHHPFVLGKHRETREQYEAIVSNISEPEKMVALLREAFIVDLEGHPWGRLLFYIIKGGKKLAPNRQIYLSQLPKLFHPICCLACGKDLPTSYQAKTIKNSRPAVLKCAKCKDVWASIRDKLESAMDVAYGFSTDVDLSVSDKVARLYEGCEALYGYIYEDSFQYKTRASMHPALLGLDTDNVSLCCIMPSTFLSRQNPAFYSTCLDKSQILIDFDQCPSSKPCIPSAYFQSRKISGAQGFKQISLFDFRNSFGDSSRPGAPVNAHWEPDIASCIRFKDLDLIVKNELLMG